MTNLAPLENFSQIKIYLQNLQHQICQALAAEDGAKDFTIDRWQHYSQDNNAKITGNTAVLTNGNVFEHAGIGYSVIEGNELPTAATAKRTELQKRPFIAAGLSLIVHPYNPYVPTTHANVRFFCTTENNNSPKPATQPIWWFGGGFDLTPYYPFYSDCQHWHKTAYDLCQPFGAEVYPKFKKWCDEYFYLPHRRETRGIGGLFFDDLNYWPFVDCFRFMRAVGNGFLTGYVPIVQQRKHMSYGECQRKFQLYRRGRYVEFNLLYDRGTLFGLQSGGRTESILMSLPPQVNWRYNWQPEPGSAEEDLYNNYLRPRDWLETKDRA